MKKGFTMAEVLITLGIIGIVAAMTLPGVMARHRSKVLEAQFHKRYNELSQALLMLKKDDIYIYDTLNGPEFQELLANRFKGAISPGRSIYLSSAEVQKNRIGYSLPKYKTFNKATEFKTAYLDDGCIIISKEFFIFLNADNWSTKNMAIIIDVNGLQKPNIFGYDVFAFKLDKTDTLIPALKTQELCDKTSTSNQNGWSCSYFAMTERDYFKNLNW